MCVEMERGGGVVGLLGKKGGLDRWGEVGGRGEKKIACEGVEEYRQDRSAQGGLGLLSSLGLPSTLP